MFSDDVELRLRALDYAVAMNPTCSGALCDAEDIYQWLKYYDGKEEEGQK